MATMVARRPPHWHGVDADDGVAAGCHRTAKGELADNPLAEHGHRPAQRQPGPEDAAEAVARDAGESRFFKRQVVRHFPESAAFVADGQEFVRGVVAGIADAVSRRVTFDGRADGHDPAGSAVPRPEGEFPVGHLRVFQPLM